MLLAAWLCSQLWAWDPVAGADGYRVYFTTDPRSWRACDFVETTAPEWDPEAGGTDLYWVAVAFNAAGESPWPVSVERTPCAE